MKIGVATASLFPMYTEKALLEMARLGVKNVEIFLNSTSELSGEIFACVRNLVREYDLNVMALHPFSSPMETLFLFSSYDRRVAELMDLYKRYFEAMNLLNESGEKIFVIHGAIAAAKCSDERYVERVAALIDAGREAGVVVAQENVSYCKSGSLDFLQMLRRELGERAVFVLDLKQARRSGICPLHMIDTLGDSIVHLHLSDAVAGDSERDCLSVGAGDFDFATMFAKLKAVGYSGGGVVELYRENYDESAELAKSVEILEKLLQTT